MVSRGGLGAAGAVLAFAMTCSGVVQAQSVVNGAGAGAVVPQVMRYSGVAAGRAGDAVEATFRVYAGPEGGEALWSETQTVRVGVDGKFSVMLGSASEGGLPQGIFSGGQGRWLGVSIERAEEQARVRLASVAYAMKAADAETLGGLAAGSFVTQAQLAATAAALTAQAGRAILPETAPGGSGTANKIAIWTNATTLGDSAVTQTGTSAPRIGINTGGPTTTLDVNGAATMRSTVNLPPASAATSAVAVNSPMLELGANSFDSGTAASVTNGYAWQAVGLGNNSTAPHANLNLMYIAGTAAPKWTGVSITPAGLINFAAGQTFPGAGSISGVTAGTGLTGGGTTGAVTLNVDATKVPLLASSNTFAGNQAVSGMLTAGSAKVGSGLSINTSGIVSFASGQTFPAMISGVTAGTGLTGGGTSGAVTLSVDATKVPLLAAANTFVGNQTITGSANVSGILSTGFVYAAKNIEAQGYITAAGQIDGADLMAVNPSAAATASAGSFSLMGPSAIAYNSATKGQVLDSFFWGAFPVGNNTASPSADLRLYFQTATTSTNTGFSINPSGIVTFASGQTFPGGQVTGNETVTGTFTASGGSFSGPLSGETTGGGLAGVSGYGKGGNPGIYANSDTGTAITGITFSPSEGQAGVLGYGGGQSATQKSRAATQIAGVWGDTTGNPNSGGYAAGIIGSADDADGGSFFNNSKSYATVYAYNGATGGVTGLFSTLQAATPTGTCGIGGNGDLSCTGQVKTLVSTGGGARTVETYSVQSPENWMEDFGSGELAHGIAVVKIDPAFAGTVSESADYHVFLTPNGDSKGLYVTRKTATSFEVHEAGGGVSSLSFDYRIVAKRRGFEEQRLVDVTDSVKRDQASTVKRLSGRGGAPAGSTSADGHLR